MKLTGLANLVGSCRLTVLAGTPHLEENVLLYNCFVLNLNDDLCFLRLRLLEAAMGGSPEKMFTNEALAPFADMLGN